MASDEPKPPSLPEDSRLVEYSVNLSDNVLGFQKFIDDVLQALEEDEKFHQMSAESYEQKKLYMKSHLSELLNMHNSLADEFGDLIEKVSKHNTFLTQDPHFEPTDSTSSPVTQSLASKFSTATGFNVLLKPDGGGFYLSQATGSSHSGSESSKSSVSKPAVPPVNVDALKVKEIKDSGLESSMSSVNKPEVPPVSDDDALKVEENKESEALLGKISSLEEEVVSLKQKVQSLTVENGELKTEIEENIEDIKLYMAESKQEYVTMEEGFNASREIVKKMDEHMSGIVVEKVVNEVQHESDYKELNMLIDQYVTETGQLKATFEKRDKIRNGVIGQLKQELNEKCRLAIQMSEHMNKLVADKSSQNIIIDQLKTELNKVKFENAGALPSFDNVEKLTNELKEKVAELEGEVQRQTEAISHKE